MSVDGSIGEAGLRRVIASLRVTATPANAPQPTR